MQRLEVLVRRKLALVEARRRGLENDPKVRGEIEEIRQNALRQEEGVLRNALFNSIRLGLQVSEEDLRAQYEKTKDRYLERQWSLRTQSFASEDEARAADKELGANGRLDPKQSEAPGPLPAEKLTRAVLVILHELKQPGDRKIVALDRWTIVELVEYLPAAQIPFDAVRDKVELNLRAIRAEEILGEELDKARSEIGVTIDEAALAAYAEAQRQPRPRRGGTRPRALIPAAAGGEPPPAASGEALQLAPRDHHLVHLVGAVGDAQRATLAPHRGDRRVVGHAERAQALDRAIEHVHQHVGHDHLDHRDLLARHLLAVGVHLPGGVEHEQARLIDLHARESRSSPARTASRRSDRRTRRACWRDGT